MFLGEGFFWGGGIDVVEPWLVDITEGMWSYCTFGGGFFDFFGLLLGEAWVG